MDYPLQKRHKEQSTYFAKKWAKKMIVKFRKGGLEHQTDIMDMSTTELIDAIEEELIDAANYMETLRFKLSKGE